MPSGLEEIRRRLGEGGTLLTLPREDLAQALAEADDLRLVRDSLIDRFEAAVRRQLGLLDKLERYARDALPVGTLAFRQSVESSVDLSDEEATRMSKEVLECMCGSCQRSRERRRIQQLEERVAALECRPDKRRVEQARNQVIVAAYDLREAGQADGLSMRVPWEKWRALRDALNGLSDATAR